MTHVAEVLPIHQGAILGALLSVVLETTVGLRSSVHSGAAAASIRVVHASCTDIKECSDTGCIVYVNRTVQGFNKMEPLRHH